MNRLTPKSHLWVFCVFIPESCYLISITGLVKYHHLKSGPSGVYVRDSVSCSSLEDLRTFIKYACLSSCSVLCHHLPNEGGQIQVSSHFSFNKFLMKCRKSIVIRETWQISVLLPAGVELLFRRGQDRPCSVVCTWPRWNWHPDDDPVLQLASQKALCSS